MKGRDFSPAAAVVVAGMAGVALAAVLYYRVVWGSVAELVIALDHCPDLYCDFTRQYYPTGQQLPATGQPSPGYFYSSFFALLLAPFGQLALEPAVGGWSVVQLVALLLLLLPAADFYRRSRPAALIYVALVAFSMPLLHNLKWGQVSTLMTGCVFATLYLDARGRWRAAAVVLGIAVAIKYYVAVITYVYLIRRSWRFLAMVTITAVFCWLVVPTLALGPDGNWAFYQTVRERVAHSLATWLPKDINSQYLPSVAGRWLGTDAARPLWQWLGYGLFAANALAVTRFLGRRGHEWIDDGWAVALLFLALPFVVNTSWPHYFVYLPFVQTLAWLRLRELGGRSWPVALGWVLLLASIVLSSMPFFQLVGHWETYSRAGVLFIANLCLFALAHGLTSGMAEDARQTRGREGEEVKGTQIPRGINPAADSRYLLKPLGNVGEVSGNLIHQVWYAGGGFESAAAISGRRDGAGASGKGRGDAR